MKTAGPPNKKPTKLTVRARIVVVAPRSGVTFALQRGRDGLEGAATSTGTDLRFDFTFLADRDADGAPRFSGEFVQGPKGGKFVYVNSGTLAGQATSAWTRRAKIGLQTLTWAMVAKAAGESGAVLEARFAGVGRDGGPACATVPLLDKGWVVTR